VVSGHLDEHFFAFEIIIAIFDYDEASLAPNNKIQMSSISVHVSFELAFCFYLNPFLASF
jgi:hypothetical protein